MNGEAVSGWLVRFSWLGLTIVLAISIGLAIFFSAGATDPQRTGPLLWQKTLAVPWFLGDNLSINHVVTVSDSAMVVPAPPFTLEITARFSSDSDPAALWRLKLTAKPAAIDMLSGQETIAIDGSGNFQHDLDQRRVVFSHLKPIGEFNRLTLNVDKNGMEILRFNNEIAWQGKYPPGLQAAILTLSAVGGWSTESRLTWLPIRLYAPIAPTATIQIHLASISPL